MKRRSTYSKPHRERGTVEAPREKNMEAVLEPLPEQYLSRVNRISSVTGRIV